MFRFNRPVIYELKIFFFFILMVHTAIFINYNQLIIADTHEFLYHPHVLESNSELLKDTY